jgi:galactose mutarotase-like enzyme
MVYVLQSDNLKVSILSKGAEISSIKCNGLEYIWQANSEVWPRHTPVLFPIVGRLKDNAYSVNDQNYSLSQHGFARDKEFKCIAQSEKEISFELNSDEDIRKMFPFDFNLFIKYTLEKDVLICSYVVTNVSSKNLFFSIGAHPGFKIPIVESETFEEYKLKFDPRKEYQTTVLKDGLLSETTEKLYLNNGELNLKNSLFDKDALVFENSQIDHLSLISPSGKGVELVCKDWPYFGIWSKKGCSEFVCLEPWYGITDSVNASRDLKTKKGIIELEGGKKFECTFSIRFF